MRVFKKDFVDQLRSQCGYTKQAALDIVEDFWKVFEMNVREGNEMYFTGSARITYSDIEERTVKAPDGNTYVVPAHRRIRFTPGKSLMEAAKIRVDNEAKGLAD